MAGEGTLVRGVTTKRRPSQEASMNYLSKLKNYARRSQQTQQNYARLPEEPIDREKTPTSDKPEKPEKSSSQQLGGNTFDPRLSEKGTPPTIPHELKGTPKSTRKSTQKSTRRASAKVRSDVAARVHKTAMPASDAQTLPSKLTLLLKVFGLSQAEAMDVSEGARWSYFRKMLAGTQPILVNPDGQLHMGVDSVWDVMASIPTDALRFKFLAALDASSLVALIKQMEGWSFQDNVNSWTGPATNDRLAAMMAFDEAYTRAFSERLKSAWVATDSNPTTNLEELGLLLKAAPIWIVGDLCKLFDREEKLLQSFRANEAFDEGWKTAQESMKNAQEKWLKDAEEKGLPPHGRAFFDEMNLSGEQGRELISRNPSLLRAIDKAQDHGSSFAEVHTVVQGDKFGLFRELVDTDPALAWRFLSSTGARSHLMNYHSGDVAELLGRIADLSAGNLRAEVDVLVQSVVVRVREVDGTGRAKEMAALILASWMSVLPPSVRSLLKQELLTAFKPESIDGWLQSSEPLNAIWQATTSLDTANASVVG